MHNRLQNIKCDTVIAFADCDRQNVILAARINQEAARNWLAVVFLHQQAIKNKLHPVTAIEAVFPFSEFVVQGCEAAIIKVEYFVYFTA